MKKPNLGNWFLVAENSWKLRGYFQVFSIRNFCLANGDTDSNLRYQWCTRGNKNLVGDSASAFSYFHFHSTRARILLFFWSCDGADDTRGAHSHIQNLHFSSYLIWKYVIAAEVLIGDFHPTLKRKYIHSPSVCYDVMSTSNYYNHLVGCICWCCSCENITRNYDRVFFFFQVLR